MRELALDVRRAPREEVLAPEHDRDEQHDEERQDERHGLEEPAHDDRPARVRRVEGAEQDERADRDAEPVEERDEVREQRPPWIDDEPADRREDEPADAGDPGDPDHARVALVRVDDRPSFSSSPRASGGTWSTAACWLSCSARTYATIAQRSCGGSSAA